MRTFNKPPSKPIFVRDTGALWTPKGVLISRSPDFKLAHPPSVGGILSITEEFAVTYDPHMRGHIGTQIRGINANMPADCHTIAELGCGTARLSLTAMAEFNTRIRRAIEGNSYSLPADFRPYRIICLDFSRDMLEKAVVNVRAELTVSKQTSPFRADLEVSTTEWQSGLKQMQLFYEHKEILTIVFACCDAKHLGDVPYGQQVEWAILSYVMHWFRGWKEKNGILRNIYAALPSGATIYSGEEWPLCYGFGTPWTDRDISLARGIVDNTTVLNFQEIHHCYEGALFRISAPLFTAQLDGPIPHWYFGQNFRKD